MRKVLILSYSYPPDGSPGALRVAALARLLPAHQWAPVIVTARNPYTRILLEGESGQTSPHVRVVPTRSLDGLAHVVRPHRWAGPRNGRPATASDRAGRGRRSPAVRATLLRWGLTVMVPDRDLPWYPFAVAAGRRVLREEPISAIYSTSPYATAHLAAMRLAGQSGLPWVAEFRDAWTPSPLYRYPLWRRKVDESLERRVFERATRIIVVTRHDQSLYEEAYPWASSKMALVRNGYDGDTYGAVPRGGADGPFVLAYAGTFYGGGRDPRPLLAAMAGLKQAGLLSRRTFKVQHIGAPESVILDLARDYGVEEMVEATGPLSYRDTAAHLVRSSALLLVTHLTWNNVPLKFYDYLGARRPILALTEPDSEVASMIRDLRVGDVFNAEDTSGVTRWLKERVEGHLAGVRAPDLPARAAAAITREAGAQAFVEQLDLAAGSPTPDGRQMAPHR